MKRKLLLRVFQGVLLAVALPACTTLYSKDRSWKLPAGLGNYEISAKMEVGFLVRHATISVNGRDVLTGQSYFWSDTISMSGAIDQFPISAVCDEKAKTCDVAIAGIHAATLQF